MGPGSRRVSNHRACLSTNIFYLIFFGYIQQVVPFYESPGSNLGRTSYNFQATWRTLETQKQLIRECHHWPWLSGHSWRVCMNLDKTKSILMQGMVMLHVLPWKLGVGRCFRENAVIFRPHQILTLYRARIKHLPISRQYKFVQRISVFHMGSEGVRRRERRPGERDITDAQDKGR